MASSVLDVAAARSDYCWHGSTSTGDRSTIRPRPDDAADAIDRLRPFGHLFGAVGDPGSRTTSPEACCCRSGGRRSIRCVRPAVLYPRRPLSARRQGCGQHRIRRGAREHRRGVLPGRRGVVSAGAPRRGGAVGNLHAARHRAGDPVRVRTGPPAATGRPGDVGDQVERAGLQHGLFWDACRGGRRGVSDHRTESLLVYAACMDLIRRPESFDVIVASNLFGES